MSAGTLSLLLSATAFAAEPVALPWLGNAAPVAPNTPMRLATADGRRLDVQT